MDDHFLKTFKQKFIVFFHSVLFVSQPVQGPDVLIKGKDWAEKGVVGREFVEGRGGEVVLADLVEGKSSTDTINKLTGSQFENDK